MRLLYWSLPHSLVFREARLHAARPGEEKEVNRASSATDLPGEGGRERGKVSEQASEREGGGRERGGGEKKRRKSTGFCWRLERGKRGEEEKKKHVYGEEAERTGE